VVASVPVIQTLLVFERLGRRAITHPILLEPAQLLEALDQHDQPARGARNPTARPGPSSDQKAAASTDFRTFSRWNQSLFVLCALAATQHGLILKTFPGTAGPTE
jgi:hypothetical protein